MDEFVSSPNSGENEEEEDVGSFFLQPASSPYNITEKVQQANIDLFNSAIKKDKTVKVTFRDEISTYEAELTDDDVNSIESDESVHSSNLQILEYRTNYEPEIVEKKFNMFEVIDEDDDDEIVEDLIIEEISEQTEPTDVEEKSLIIEEEIKSTTVSSKSTKTLSTPSTKKLANKKGRKKPIPQLDEVICKNHCLEKVENLSISVKKLEIKEKPADCPLLKLRPRKCCDLNKIRNPQNLPCYNGLRSEYGLSSTELEKREKQKQQVKLKEQKRQQLLEEYRCRKIQQNEQVFCQWLKDVARRHKVAPQNKPNKEKSGDNNNKQCLSPSIINFALRDGRNERPSTANDFIPKHNIKRAKRPYTSPCVFIQVPPKLLEKGITIGDLLVTNNSTNNNANAKLNILTLS